MSGPVLGLALSGFSVNITPASKQPLSDHIPPSIDLMPLDARKPRAGPLLEPAEAIAIALMYAVRCEAAPDPNGLQVQAVLKALTWAGYKIEPI